MRSTGGYEFDVLGELLRREIAAGVAAARRKLRKPLRVMTIYRDAAESFLPRQVLLYWTKSGRWISYREADVVLDAPVIETRVPFSVYDVEDGGDRVLPAFLRRNGLRRHDGWGEALAVPRLLLQLELSRAYLTLPGLLAEAGVALAKDFQLWNHSPAGLNVLRDAPFDAEIRAELRKLVKTDAQLREFARLCYAGPDRQEWLFSLGARSPGQAKKPSRATATTEREGAARKAGTSVARAAGKARAAPARTAGAKAPGPRRSAEPRRRATKRAGLR